MSPKKKKLQAALEQLFSTAPRGGLSAAPVVLPNPGTGLEGPAPLPPLASRPLPAETKGGDTSASRPASAGKPEHPHSQNGQQPASPQRAVERGPAEAARKLLVFTLAGVSYGLDIAAIESIIKVQPVTFVPHARPWVEGVTNLRGTVLPVISLRRRLGMPAQEAGKDTRIMVVISADERVGVIVDSVSEVLAASPRDFEPPPPLVANTNPDFMTGILKAGDRMVILLDVGKVLA